MNNRIKILVVDNSNLIRFKLKSIFEPFDVEGKGRKSSGGSSAYGR